MARGARPGTGTHDGGRGADAGAARRSGHRVARMMRALFTKVAPQFGLDAYFNFMVEDSGDALRLESCIGISEEEARTITRLHFGQAICGTVALRRQPIMATRIHKSDDPKAQLVR